MGFYETEYWLSDTWGMNRAERKSGAYHPYVPSSLSNATLSLSAEASAAIAQAQAEILLLNSASVHLGNSEPLAQLMLRSEAVASSRIEGLEMPVVRLLELEALDELGVMHRTDRVEAAILANISAMRDSVEKAASSALTVETICNINKNMLAGTSMETYGGQIRTEQNWIGGNASNPIGAAYVPPKPDYVPALLDDLVRFVNESTLPPLATAAIAHAQLETVHPFADGNGRTGRALVHVILKCSGIANEVIPPISLVLSADKQRYIANLASFRSDEDKGESALSGIDGWVEYFATMALESCGRAREFGRVLTKIETSWRERMKPRSGSAADILLGKLIDEPVVSIKSATHLCGRSGEATRNALAALTNAGILVQNARNRKSSLFVAQEVVDAFTYYERALATTSGDTAVEKPAKPVPQRPKKLTSAEALAAARQRHVRDES